MVPFVPFIISDNIKRFVLIFKQMSFALFLFCFIIIETKRSVYKQKLLLFRFWQVHCVTPKLFLFFFLCSKFIFNMQSENIF